jgi:hypothetical protein
LIDAAEASARAFSVATNGRDTPIVILETATLEFDFGWVFFYEAERFVATGDETQRLIGNAPIIVDRASGRALITGTSLPIEDYIAAFRALGPERFASSELVEYLRARNSADGI